MNEVKRRRASQPAEMQLSEAQHNSYFSSSCFCLDKLEVQPVVGASRQDSNIIFQTAIASRSTQIMESAPAPGAAQQAQTVELRGLFNPPPATQLPMQLNEHSPSHPPATPKKCKHFHRPYKQQKFLGSCHP